MSRSYTVGLISNYGKFRAVIPPPVNDWLVWCNDQLIGRVVKVPDVKQAARIVFGTVGFAQDVGRIRLKRCYHPENKASGLYLTPHPYEWCYQPRPKPFVPKQYADGRPVPLGDMPKQLQDAAFPWMNKQRVA
jgi:hypothetical protein